ncbi:hypothetical protein [Streptomyces sp. NRRL S-1022]|uniref:hypothetical protein n=1 Tax=Streptomyces sp. NRRL S-1022 TaxID=1463880 RepID=UPI000690AFBC|nr:hypothetical protein [Streptomyces sp. NRRL S-1022]
MDALTKLNVLGVVLSAVLVAMACVKTDRVRAWRANLNPSAPELPGSAFVAARLIFLGLASIGVYTSVQGFNVSDDVSWSDGELTTAVRQATDELDGFTFQADDGGNPLPFTDYASLLKDKVIQHGGGDAPEYGVTTEPAEGNTLDDAFFTVTGDGADRALCAHIKRIRSEKDDYSPPGIAGGEGTLTYPGYRLAASARDGEC